MFPAHGNVEVRGVTQLVIAGKGGGDPFELVGDFVNPEGERLSSSGKGSLGHAKGSAFQR